MISTPFYYYDLELLSQTISSIKEAIDGYPFKVHYALKANVEEKILHIISSNGFGADCVSGNEIKKALQTGFNAQDIVLAGVGKNDDEIKLAIENNIHSINCESIEEIKVIAELAQGSEVPISLRLNPNINANTLPKITTGTYKNKFGIPTTQIWEALELIEKYEFLNFIGIHVHLGSQITNFIPFKNLAFEINKIQSLLFDRGKKIKHLNVGGGLGIDYENPTLNPIPDFKGYFGVFKKYLHTINHQTVHFELGRSIIGQSGSLISKVLYVKEVDTSKFVIIDAGMTDLMRPALYNSYHLIENISSEKGMDTYQVVGPICESTDSFGSVHLPITRRGDFIKIYSTGAYGQVLSSNYNLRTLPKAIYSSQISLGKVIGKNKVFK